MFRLMVTGSLPHFSYAESKVSSFARFYFKAIINF